MAGGFHVFVVVSLIMGGFSSLIQTDIQGGANRQEEYAAALANSQSQQEELQVLRNQIQQLQERNQRLLSSGSEANRKLAVVERQTRNGTLLRPTDCTDLLISGVTDSGVYQIYPFLCSCTSGIDVYCDMETDGGGWTVILNRAAVPDLQTSRISGQLNFNQSWEEYKAGFGSVYGEYYLGNEYIHRITNSRDYTFRMDMHRVNGELKTLSYDNFRVQNEQARYRLSLGNRQSESSTTYDCYIYNRNRDFSTYDRDFDASTTKNCASNLGGGFWYYDCSRLPYSPTGPIENGYMNISCYYSYENYELTKLQIKIRPSLCDATYKKITVATNCASGTSRGCRASSSVLP
ncbi:techylectin-5A-like [Palaemon carinicauda]|uniref:techylectin-5A-like n=1 Tax=Palaemon carinicauda TaxID=392227 RepID=UPI0035B6321F